MDVTSQNMKQENVSNVPGRYAVVIVVVVVVVVV